MFTIENAKGMAYLWVPGPLGSPNHINYYILGFGGLDYNLGELNWFIVRHTKEFVYPKDPGTPGPPKQY